MPGSGGFAARPPGFPSYCGHLLVRPGEISVFLCASPFVPMSWGTDCTV